MPVNQIRNTTHAPRQRSNRMDKQTTPGVFQLSLLYPWKALLLLPGVVFMNSRSEFHQECEKIFITIEEHKRQVSLRVIKEWRKKFGVSVKLLHSYSMQNANGNQISF